MSQGKIWCNRSLSASAEAQLREGVKQYHFVWRPDFDGEDPEVEDADILFGTPAPRHVLKARALRWLHVSSAGYGTLSGQDVRDHLLTRSARMTKSSAVYGEPCAQHLLACMLSHSRALPLALDTQRTTRAWQHAELRQRSRLLVGQRVVIFGGGAIATRLVELLAPFRLHVVMVRRSPTGSEPVLALGAGDPAVLEYVAQADHLVDALPGTAETVGWVSRALLAASKPGAAFYNVGRGTTVDQNALLELLQSGHLGAAYLDVTTPEPLPPDHPLWDAPGCYLTPHSAGGHHNETERLVEHFLDNLRRLERGAALVDVVI